MKKKIMAIVMAIISISMLAVSSYAADSDQIYIENNSAQVIKMTASLYGYTSNGSSITLGSAILRTDVRSGQNPTYSAVSLDATLYKNYTETEYATGFSRLITGIVASGVSSESQPIGQHITTDSVSINAENVGGHYRMETPSGLTVVATLGIILNDGGTLSQDSLATTTSAY